jgi:hypothetical protein
MIRLNLEPDCAKRHLAIRSEKQPPGPAERDAALRLVEAAEQLAVGTFLDFEALRESLEWTPAQLVAAMSEAKRRDLWRWQPTRPKPRPPANRIAPKPRSPSPAMPASSVEPAPDPPAQEPQAAEPTPKPKPTPKPSPTALPLALQETLAAAARIEVGGKVGWSELAEALGCSLTAVMQRAHRLKTFGLWPYQSIRGPGQPIHRVGNRRRPKGTPPSGDLIAARLRVIGVLIQTPEPTRREVIQWLANNKDEIEKAVRNAVTSPRRSASAR